MLPFNLRIKKFGMKISNIKLTKNKFLYKQETNILVVRR